MTMCTIAEVIGGHMQDKNALGLLTPLGVHNVGLD